MHHLYFISTYEYRRCKNIVIVYDLKQEQNATQTQHKVHEMKETRRECPE